jgi:hypothetical protein
VVDWCDQCHRKKGLVVWPDLPRLSQDHPQGEALAALMLGKVDAFEICFFAGEEPQTLADWYRLLDCGLRIPLVGGSGKDSNAVALGGVRTYAQLAAGEELTYGGWIGAVRAGRTFVTNGPLLLLTVAGHGPGAVIHRRTGSLPVQAEGQAGSLSYGNLPVRVEAHSAVPFDEVELLVNGFVHGVKTASGNRQSAVLETEIPLTSAWVAARCWSRERLPSGQNVYAHTSPVYLDVEDQLLQPDAEVVGPLLGVLDHTLDWAMGEGHCDTKRQREQLGEVLRSAFEELVRRQGKQ